MLGDVYLSVSLNNPWFVNASGNASLQNALELVHEQLNQVEVLILYSALCTCDPGDTMEAIRKCKKSKLRCSVIGLSAEMFICKHLCQETGGLYSVAVDEVSFSYPRCKARVCDLPTECAICGLTLVSSPHLARSYHHLFPIAPFDEVPALLTLNDPRRILEKSCFGCQQSLLGAGNNKPGPCVTCRKCKHYFCLDCDIYIHETDTACSGQI